MASFYKELMLNEIKETLGNNDVFFASFDKVTVESISNLRRSLRKNDASGMVVKNKLARIALKDLGMQQSDDILTGAMFLVSAPRDPQNVSKDLVDYAKKEEAFSIKGVFTNGTFYTGDYVSDLAQLPSREQLLASVVGGIKAPITNFVLGLNGLLRSVVVVLNEVKKAKESQ